MKTLFFFCLMTGLLLVQPVSAFTTLNLPRGDVNLTSYENLAPVIPINTMDRIEVNNIPSETEKYEDTVVINLSEVVISSPFPVNKREYIIEQVDYPSFARKELLEGAVTVRFVFDDSGRLHVLESNATDARLDRYVREKMESLRLNHCMVGIDSSYYIRFTFKLL